MSSLVHDFGLSRGACDRCHGQKLRCRPGSNSDGCLRCQRAGVRCTPRVARSSRQRARSLAAQQGPNQGSNPTQHNESSGSEQTNKEIPEQLGLSPSSLLDAPSDSDFGLNFSSLQSEFDSALEARCFQSGLEPDDMSHDFSSQQYSQQVSRSSGAGSGERGHESQLPEDPYRMISPAFTMLPPYSEGSTNRSRHTPSMARPMTPRSVTSQPQEPATSNLMSFDQLEMNAIPAESEHSAPDSGYGRSVSRPQSINSEFAGNYNPRQQVTRSVIDPAMTSWIRKLSDINVELHQHMLSIPPLDLGQSTWTNGRDRTSTNGIHSNQHDQELRVDSTIRLSHQYMEILNDMFSRLKGRHTASGNVANSQQLDQSSQLLVLSSYLCLIQSYDKILRHIKIWTEARLKMGAAVFSKSFPIQLPSVAIGTFEFLTSSSSRPLIMTCILKSLIIQVRSLVDEIMKPASIRNETTRASNGAGGSQEMDDCDGLSGVPKVTLQAIRAKEDATIKLVDVTWRLVLQCGAI